MEIFCLYRAVFVAGRGFKLLREMVASLTKFRKHLLGVDWFFIAAKCPSIVNWTSVACGTILPVKTTKLV